MTFGTSTITDPKAAFRSAMTEAGIVTSDRIVADGKLRRVQVEGDRRGSNNGWYVLHPDDPPAGAFGSWRTGLSATWCGREMSDLSPVERDRLRERMEAAKAEREAEVRRRRARAREKAARLWKEAEPADPSHPYLKAKGVRPHRIRQSGSQLLVPVWSSDGTLHGLQRIGSDGDKRFLAGTAVSGAYHPIGKPDGVLAVVEGYATGATVHETTGAAVAVAFNAGNLLPVSRALQEKLPETRIIIVADNDRRTEGNPGLRYAREAAAALEAELVVPEFEEDEPGSDFNDLAATNGSDAVWRCFAPLFPREKERPAVEPPHANGNAGTPPPPMDGPEVTEDDHAPDEGETDNLAHDALALGLGERWRESGRYVAAWSRWYHFDGHVWREDDSLLHMTQTREFLREKAQELEVYAANGDGSEKEAGEARRHAKTLRSAPTVAQVVGLAQSNPTQAATVGQWDADPWALGTPGGTVNLRTGELRPAHYSDYITKAVTVVPAPPGTSTPLWDRFLDTVTDGDKELQAYLRRFAGYSLTGSIREHVFAFGHGTGANGKGTFLNALKAIMGDYAASVPTEMLMVSQNDRHPTELARLRGIRLAIASETEQGRRWAESRIKALTGGDPIAARFMRADFFEFEPQFKLFIVGNHRPSLRGVDEAMRRRLHFIPFEVTIPPADRDPDLSEKLQAEWPGILRWAINGCLEWQRGGLNAPASVHKATEEYFEDEDAVGLWLSECTAPDANGWESSGALFSSWKAWAESAGEFVGTKKRFAQVLEERGMEPKRKPQARGFMGVRLNVSQEPTSPRWEP